MPMSNSESRKRVAELAAGSGDETCRHGCCPDETCGIECWLNQRVSFTRELPEANDGNRWSGMDAANREVSGWSVMGGRRSTHPAPVQPPAPDPDETCDGTEACEASAHLTDCPNDPCEGPCINPTPAPPATTGPADEAEGLAEVIGYYCSHVGEVDPSIRTGCRGCYTLAEHVLDSDWLTARDAAQQRIGAEKAWDEAVRAVANVDPKAIHNPYRST